MSGYELAKEIRSMKRPVSKIALLAFSSSSTVRAKIYEEFGFNGFLPKPIQRKKLLKMVANLVCHMAVSEKRILLVDCDPQGNATIKNPENNPLAIMNLEHNFTFFT